MPQRHPPRLLDGRLAARHRHIIEVREPLEARVVCDQHFPSPYLSIRPVARAVQCQANHLAREAVLGHASSHVRMMMLHGNQLQAALFSPLPCPRRRKVARMQVMHHGLRLNLESPHQVIERLFEKFQPCQVFQIAQVLALEGKPSPRQRKDILQVAPNGQQWRNIKGQRHPHRHKSACSPDQLRRAIYHGGHRIVAALQNLAVVHQEGIGNPAQSRPRLFVINCNWFFAEVGRGHHQRLHASVGKEQMLQRRIRQINAQPGNTRCNAFRNPAVLTPARQHNRPRWRREQRLFFSRQHAHLPRRLQVAHHHCQRLSIAAFALPQTHHRCLAGCIHAQMKAADPFDSYNLPRCQQLKRLLDCLIPSDRF